jgi:DNA-binding response OmpR family regulator
MPCELRVKRRALGVNSSQFTAADCRLHSGFTRAPYIRAVMRPLAIIEVESAHAASVRESLEAAGFRSECFSTGSAALPRLRAQEFALAIVDLDLRDTDPFALCNEASRLMPVITVASACAEEACIRALECGADDCIQRRTSGRELVARVRGVLRRTDFPDLRPSSEAFAISIAEMRVRADGVTHNLTRGETEVLALLVDAPAPVSALRMAALLQARRGTVESRIKSLRRKLGPGRLVSRGSLGYQLVSSVDGV